MNLQVISMQENLRFKYLYVWKAGQLGTGGLCGTPFSSKTGGEYLLFLTDLAEIVYLPDKTSLKIK
jgi:hypothetical protein